MASTRNSQPEHLELRSPRGLRSPSSSSDIISTSGRSLAGGVPIANPPPLFVAHSAAETLTSAELERPVVVSEAAVELVNSFLDQTLYSLLSLSKSTSLAAVRGAVPKLLKPRLGQAALSAGEEEVRDILEASEFDPSQGHTTKSRPSDFDLELVWKLARLRCMVYSRLGDLEEEDEEELLEQEGLSEHMQNPKTSTTPIEALFLAAIVGFLGEQALCTAAQHAEKRHDQQPQNKATEETEREDGAEDELVLEPVDMLQLGREGPLSRLWRSWRRDTRSTENGPSRPGSQSIAHSMVAGESSHARKTSLASKAEAIPEEDSPKSLTPSQIPLPMRDTDVDEIEVPGLAPPLDGEEETDMHVPKRSTRRPNSALIIPPKDGLIGSLSSEDKAYSERSPLRPHPYRNRSQSAPTPDQPTFSTAKHYKDKDTVILSPDDETIESDTDEAALTLRSQDSVLTDEKTHDQKHQREHSGAKASIISGTVAAIAGALGVEAMKQSRMSKDQQDQTFKSAQRGEQSKKSRTVAEEIMGPNNHVPPPTDAHTGASITGPSDFDSMYVPPSEGHHTHSSSGRGDRAVSDPEDLALSSADEENVLAEPPPPQYSTRGNMPTSIPSSPSSPKRVKREVAVYENHMIPMRSDEDEVEDRTRMPSDDASPTQTAVHDGQNRDSIALPIQQPGPSSAIYPHRGSSRDQHSYQHTPGKSKSSVYSQHSRRSGSSNSGKVFVHSKEQNSRTQNMSQQRATFSDSPQGGQPRNISKELQQPGNMTSGRGRLRLDEDGISKVNEQKKKSLEILIKSDETLHYTLTPESARATEFSPNDIKPKTETQDLADFIRNTAPPGDELSRPSTSRQDLKALRSNPPDTTSVAHALNATSSASQAPSQHRNTIGAPRDARPERNTTRDLADYVRSTGPANEAQLAQALGTRPSTGNVGPRGGLRSDGVPVAPMGNPSLDSTRPSTNSERPANRLKFQARDARPARNTETSELIDFIREGPPRTVGDHRIDRKVAPFRTTMDSDDLMALAPPPEVSGRASEGSAPGSAITSKSVQESTSSRTALLDSTSRASGRNMNTVSSATNGVSRKVVPEQNGMPPRTRRRVRDPYAIEDSDDELELEQVRRKPAKQEESLIDFLRNTAPPPGMSPQPILAAAPQTETKPEVKRSASNSKLRDVLTRQGSFVNRNSTVSQVPNGSSARERSPHLTQVGSKLDKYRPTQPTHAAHAERNRQRSRGEARAPTNDNGTTADLADYLKNTGPPDAPRQQDSQMKDQAGFLKFFLSERKCEEMRSEEVMLCRMGLHVV